MLDSHSSSGRLKFNVWGKRAASGTLAMLALLSLLWFASLELMAIVAGLACVVGTWEFGRIVGRKKGVVLSPNLLALWGGLCAAGAWWGGVNGLNAIMVLAMLQLVLLRIYLPKSLKAESAQVVGAVWGFCGLAFVVWPLGHLVLLVGLFGREPLLLLLVVVAGNDTVAFFSGKRWGRRLLMPTVSPGKTLEGGLGGLLGGICGAAFAMLLFEHLSALNFDLSLWEVVWLGSLLSFTAQAGDLMESYIKRQCGVKDSGYFLPGHGGLLDRLDSWLLSAPATYYVLWAGLV